jgi:hypothetical protein
VYLDYLDYPGFLAYLEILGYPDYPGILEAQ